MNWCVVVWFIVWFSVLCCLLENNGFYNSLLGYLKQNHELCMCLCRSEMKHGDRVEHNFNIWSFGTYLYRYFIRKPLLHWKYTIFDRKMEWFFIIGYLTHNSMLVVFLLLFLIESVRHAYTSWDWPDFFSRPFILPVWYVVTSFIENFVVTF